MFLYSLTKEKNVVHKMNLSLGVSVNKVEFRSLDVHYVL